MEIIVGRGRSFATQRVEIDDPEVSRKHCVLTDNGDGSYTLENKSPNGTYVDGLKVLKTRVTKETVIKLSKNTAYSVAELLPLPQSQPKPTPEPESFSIKPLEAVWDEYHDKLLEIQLRQRNINMLRGASPIFTLGSGAIAGVAKSMEWGDVVFGITIVMTVIGLLLMVYCFVVSFADKSIEKREAATDELTQKYVCPNPDCKHFMGNQPYKVLRQSKTCPWCKCKLKE